MTALLIMQSEKDEKGSYSISTPLNNTVFVYSTKHFIRGNNIFL